MAVSVDQELCIGCGICVDSCSDIFSFNADGKAEAIKQVCENCNVEEVADLCPVNAIEVSK